jgi:predicted nucleotidyltransferase
MVDSQSNRLSHLPGEVRARLDALVESLRDLLQEDLLCVLVHGSVARGEYQLDQSDVDLIVVVESGSPAALQPIANALALARYSARIEAMVLTAAEIPRAADVFPLLYDEVQRRNIVLFGESPFASLRVSDQHRRLRIEQELRDAQIRLRRIGLDAQGGNRALSMALSQKVRQLRAPLCALLGLRGREVGEKLESILTDAGAFYEVDISPLLASSMGSAALSALSALLERAVDDVDRLAVAVSE